jgi:hypothetical protein
MTPIRTRKEAVVELLDLGADKAAITKQIGSWLKSGRLQLDSTELGALCEFLSISLPQVQAAGGRKYGQADAFSASSSQDVGGAPGAQLTATKYGAPPSIAWSDFAAERHLPGTGHSYFRGTKEELLALVKEHWDQRTPGAGRTNLDEVVLVPVPPNLFVGSTVKVTSETPLHTKLYRRRAHEEPYLRITAEGEPEPTKFAQVVLYSKDTLGANNERSSKADWEIVSIVAGPVENEPMDPLTMARNMLGKTGGSQVDYSAQQLAEAIWYWAQHAKVHTD